MTFPLPGANWSYLHSLRLVATAGAAGFALQNATPGILTWTAPADGNEHRALIFASQHVTSAETGGAVKAGYTLPDGSTGAPGIFGGGSGAGTTQALIGIVVEAGSTVTVSQTSALSLGAATVWAEIWAYLWPGRCISMCRSAAR